MRRLGATTLVVAAAAMAIAGCGSDDEPASTSTGAAATATAATASTAPPRKPADVAFMAYALTDYSQVEEQGLKDAVTPGGGSVTLFNSEFDPQKQAQQCKDAITSGRYDVIALSVPDAPLGLPCVAAAKAAGIPVIALEVPVGTDRDTVEPQLDGIVGSVVQTTQGVADEQAAQVKQACAGIDPCKVIAEIAAPGDANTGRSVEEIKKFPNVEVVQVLAGKYDPALIAKLMPDALTAHPDVDVYLSAADSQALAALPAFKAAGLLGEVKIIGGSGSRLGARAVADGTLYSTSANYPLTFAKLAGEMAIKAVNGETIDPAGVDALKIKQPSIVTKENVEEFEPEWGRADG